MIANAVKQSPLGKDIGGFLTLAIPLASAQVAQATVGLVDTIMMGHLGTESLAAGGLASTLFQFCLTTVSGIVMAVSPLVAEAYGAGQTARVEHIARQGLWLVLVLSLPLMVMIGHLDTGLLALGQPEAIATRAAPYFQFIVWGIFPALGFAMLRSYVSALSQAHIVTIIVIIGTLVNITGNYVLGFGKLGFPRMELAGLGLSSGLSFWLMFIIFLIYTLKHPQLRHYRFLHNFHRVNLKILRQLTTMGVAIAITIALEYGLFATVTFLMGILGTDMLAAHQTVYQTMYIIFMVPLGMSYAMTARVGQWFGQKDMNGARRAGYVGMVIAGLFMLVTAIALVVYRRQVIGIYINIDHPDNAQVLALAIPMLFISSVAQLLDGIQRVAMGALHGLQDTRIPMVISGLAFWGVGLTSGYVLGFTLGFEGVGLWIGQSIGVAVAGLISILRFQRLTGRRATVLSIKP